MWLSVNSCRDENRVCFDKYLATRTIAFDISLGCSDELVQKGLVRHN